MTERQSMQAKRFAGGSLLLLLAWLLLYHDVLRRLVGDWREDENYSHGFLIPLISAYAIWTKREQLRDLLPNPQTLWGVGVSLGACLLLWLGELGRELYLTRLSLLFSLIGLTLYFCGWAWLRALAFPLGLLLFALPIPALVFNPLAFEMQLLASDFATRAIRWFGIPALRDGNIIELARMQLQVVEACSGIRSLVTLAALAAVYAYFFERQWWRRVVLLLAVAPLAIIANAARVTGTALLAERYGTQAAEGFLHSFSGAAVFLVAVGLLLALAQLLSWGAALVPASWKPN